MQMLSPLEQLEVLLIGEVKQMVLNGYDVLSVRRVVANDLMPKFPQFYSWVTRSYEDEIKIEIFDRRDGKEPLLRIDFDFVKFKSRP